MNKKGTPAVYTVRYPDGSNSRRHDLSKSPGKDRTKLFIAFAVILNKFKKFFEISVRETYEEQVQNRIKPLENLATYSPNGRTTGRNNAEKDVDTNDSSRGRDPPRKTEEQFAKEAAACGGMFSNLVNPLDLFFRLGDTGKEHTVSPFYFRGCSTTATSCNMVRDVFLKVWRDDEIAIDSVRAEWKYHKQAYNAGIPVAVPVLSELAKSSCSRGFVYLVFAVEYIHQDDIDTFGDLWQFSCSLMETVLMLHQKAKMLHCDLKPGNLRWHKNVVRLIDFEHAQDIANPDFAPGTEGYQAPEILNGMPCSTKTDAFAVGKTIFNLLSAFRMEKLSSEEKQPYFLLQDVSLKLADPHPDSRWSLSQALAALRNSKKKDSHTMNMIQSLIKQQPAVLPSRLV